MTNNVAAIYAQNQTLLIAAATAAAGPNATKQEITDRVRTMLELHTELSPIETMLYNLSKRMEKIGEIKKFTGTVVHVDKELNSKRAIVVLHTGSEKSKNTQNAHGQEILYTERFEGERDENVEARQIANEMNGYLDEQGQQVGGLIGHRVSVIMSLSQRDSGRFRTLVAYTDLGPDNEYDFNDQRFRLSPGHSANGVKLHQWARASSMAL